MSRGAAQVHIGISGWRYVPWRGDFYPEGLRQKDELIHNSEVLSMEADHRLLNGLQMIVSLLSLSTLGQASAAAAAAAPAASPSS